MSNPNFVSDLVAMAKAFEELPDVKAALEAKTHDFDVAQQMIQRLELRLMDLKNEVDAAHAATRKVEVERDHAERMFLETDDRLNAFRRLVQAFDTDVKSLVAAAEPEPQPEPVIEALTVGAESAVDPTSAPIHNSPTSPTPAADTEASSVASVESTSTSEAVSVQPDPTPAMPDAPQAEASLSVSAGENSATTESAGSNWGLRQPDHGSIHEAPSYHSEVAVPTDPTASFVAGDGHSLETVEATPTVEHSADASSKAPSTTSADDPGYHNEPKITVGENGWQAWDDWCARMNAKFGPGGWPPRNVPSIA